MYHRGSHAQLQGVTLVQGTGLIGCKPHAPVEHLSSGERGEKPALQVEIWRPKSTRQSAAGSCTRRPWPHLRHLRVLADAVRSAAEKILVQRDQHQRQDSRRKSHHFGSKIREMAAVALFTQRVAPPSAVQISPGLCH